ncbi:MAG TPA: SatD family protein [Bacillota bacterium]|nr:SatD family protein [Bacillota bacterium]HPO98079.1 SatD family protein [Bacillota bacterium]
MKVMAVITADIIDSSTHPNFEQELKQKLQTLNSPGLLTPFTLYRGDEIQAVCQQLQTLPNIIRQLRFYSLPLKLRIGVGIGKIETNGSTANNSWEMNGDAFFKARDALDKIKKDKRPKTKFVTESEIFDLTGNIIYELVDNLIANWTAAQWEAISILEKHGTYQQVANILNVSRQSVQKRCYAANWELVKNSENGLAQLLEYYFY